MKIAQKVTKKTNVIREADEVEEIESGAGIAVAEESEGEREEVEMVKFALTQDIDPAPRVGNISMLHDYGITILKKGIVTIPKIVAIHLQDKKYGEIL